ncbi:hypothetical protein QOT17_024255 [Balamuthia mandrillaris]
MGWTVEEEALFTFFDLFGLSVLLLLGYDHLVELNTHSRRSAILFTMWIRVSNWLSALLKDRLICVLEEDINSFYKVADVGVLKLEAVKPFGEVLGVFLLCLLESVIQFLDALLCRVEFPFCDR